MPPNLRPKPKRKSDSRQDAEAVAWADVKYVKSNSVLVKEDAKSEEAPPARPATSSARTTRSQMRKHCQGFEKDESGVKRTSPTSSSSHSPPYPGDPDPGEPYGSFLRRLQLPPCGDCVAEGIWIKKGHVPNRRVAEDGKEYTLEEYTLHYGYFSGCQKWNEAPDRTTAGIRRVAEDGKEYTLLEFRAFYGPGVGGRKWNEATNRTTV
jgi:hypothetical protein